jgi:hypothetical protein
MQFFLLRNEDRTSLFEGKELRSTGMESSQFELFSQQFPLLQNHNHIHKGTFHLISQGA